MELVKLGSPLEKAYRRSLYCTTDVIQLHGKLEAKYCRGRWCTCCNRIRMAKAIRTYGPILDTWDDVQFVTLTLPSVPGYALRGTLDWMTKEAWKKAKNNVKRVLKRKGIPFRGCRVVEATYNVSGDRYHPHFHVILEGRLAAEKLVDAWLKQVPRARKAAQHIRPCDENALVEVFKYAVKLISRDKRIDAKNLDVIFQAFYKRPLLCSFGFVLPGGDDDENFELDQSTVAWKRVEEKILWRWQQDQADWIDLDSGERLTGYEPSERDRAFVEATTTDKTLSDVVEPLDGPESDVEPFPDLLTNANISEPVEMLSNVDVPGGDGVPFNNLTKPNISLPVFSGPLVRIFPVLPPILTLHPPGVPPPPGGD